MSAYDKLFLACYFFVIIVVQCFWQRRLFIAQRKISHSAHAFYYLLTMLPMIYFFSEWWWQLVGIGLLERLAIFDPTLNIIRGKPVLYNGMGGSWMDRIENRLSRVWVVLLKLLYIASFLIFLILIE